METKKKPIFRINMRDLRTNKHKVITAYSNGEKDPSLEQMKEKITNCIEGKKQ